MELKTLKSERVSCLEELEKLPNYHKGLPIILKILCEIHLSNQFNI